MAIEAKFRTKSTSFVDERELELKAEFKKRLERSLSSKVKSTPAEKVAKEMNLEWCVLLGRLEHLLQPCLEPMLQATQIDRSKVGSDFRRSPLSTERQISLAY